MGEVRRQSQRGGTELGLLVAADSTYHHHSRLLDGTVQQHLLLA